MKIENGTLAQLDLEYLTQFALAYRMKNKNSPMMHDFLTSIEGLLPAYSTEFLKRMKKEFKRGVRYGGINKRNFQDTIEEIDKELEKRTC